jgi:hypothetical protein
MRIGNTAYLAVVFGCNVETYQTKDHGRESGQARNRVDLPKGTDKTRNQKGNANHHRPILSSDTDDALG